jgi:CDP-alcohol phosphatidyltransferase
MSEPIKRASEIEEPTNVWIFQPLSSAIVPWLARFKFSANMVSVLGMVFGLAAAFFYAHYAVRPSWCYIGFGLMLLWHVFDGADGQLARLTNTQSEFGKIIDGICDYVVFISVYVAITWASMQHHGPWIWWISVGAGIAHAIQAGAYETQRQMFDFWGLAKKSAALSDPTAKVRKGFAAKIAFGYGKMQFRFSGLTRNYFDALDDFAKHKPDALPQMRIAYRRQFASSVHRWSVMCANYRTFGIFIACLIGQPLIFFIWEIVILGVLHIFLISYQRRLNETFVASLKSKHLNSAPA